MCARFAGRLSDDTPGTVREHFAAGEWELAEFGSSGPAGAPAPGRADVLLSTDARYHGGRRLRRAWREPLDGAPDGATWVYVLQVTEGTDELKAYSGLASRLWVVLAEKYGLEVVVEGRSLPPYQAAALTPRARSGPADAFGPRPDHVVGSGR